MKQLLKVVEVLPKRQFDSRSGEIIEVVPLRLMQGRDQFIADAVGSDARLLSENLGGGDYVWADLSFSVREWEKDGQNASVSKVRRL